MSCKRGAEKPDVPQGRRYHEGRAQRDLKVPALKTEVMWPPTKDGHQKLGEAHGTASPPQLRREYGSASPRADSREKTFLLCYVCGDVLQQPRDTDPPSLCLGFHICVLYGPRGGLGGFEKSRACCTHLLSASSRLGVWPVASSTADLSWPQLTGWGGG